MGGACSSFTTSSSPTIYSTSVTDSKAMQVESCSSALGVSNRGVSEKQLTSNTVQQHPSTPKRHTVLYISPPPEDLLDNSRMSCQDEGCALESEQSCSMWMEDSPSNFSNMSTSSYNDNTEVPRKSRKRNPKQRPGVKRRDCEESNMDIFDADSAKAPHYVLSQLTTDNKGNSKAGNGTLENQKGTGVKKLDISSAAWWVSVPWISSWEIFVLTNIIILSLGNLKSFLRYIYHTKVEAEKM